MGDELLQAIAVAARTLLGAAACSIALLSEDESELVYTTSSSRVAGDVTGMRMAADRGIAGYVVASGEAMAVSEAASNERFARDVAEETGYVPRSILAVPVRTPSRVLGVLTVLDRDDSRPRAEDDLRLLGVLADQAAYALEAVREAALGSARRDGGGAASGLRVIEGGSAGGSVSSGSPHPAGTEHAAGGREADMSHASALISELALMGPEALTHAVALLELVVAHERGVRRADT